MIQGWGDAVESNWPTRCLTAGRCSIAAEETGVRGKAKGGTMVWILLSALNFMLKFNPQCNSMGVQIFGGDWVIRAEPSWIRLDAFIKRFDGGTPFLFMFCFVSFMPYEDLTFLYFGGRSVQDIILETQSSPHWTTEPAIDLILEFPACRTVKNKYLFLMNYTHLVFFIAVPSN